jgi:CheY-like chemotaxis protein
MIRLWILAAIWLAAVLPIPYVAPIALYVLLPLYIGCCWYQDRPAFAYDNDMIKELQTLMAQPMTEQLRILLVDDNVDSVESMAVLLSLHGHEVETANDGSGAIAAAISFSPDVIVLDIGLPDMDGFSCCSKLRRDGYTGVIIAATGHGSFQDKQQALAVGFDRHLTKPVTYEQLEETWMDLIPQSRLAV